MIRREVQIGSCRLLLGDALEILPTLAADHVIMDPPYEASLHNARAHLTKLRKDSGPELKEIDFAAIDLIRDQVVALGSKVCSGWFLAFCTIEGVRPWAEAINASPMRYKRACVWVKPDSTPQLNGQGPAVGAECFVAAWNGKGAARWNAGGKRGVYTHIVNPRDRHGKHPTEKPWRLFAELLTDFTKPGDVVLDPFLGSGTTLVACAKMGRSGIGIEVNPEYFEIAVRRVQDAYRQSDMFVAPPTPPKQEAFF